MNVHTMISKDNFLLYVLLLLTSSKMATIAYSSDEVECPDTIHTGITSVEYWAPIGSDYRAWKTLPWKYFVIKPSNLPNAGLGVFTTTFIPQNTWLGEYEGEIVPIILLTENQTMDYAWMTFTDDIVAHFIDAINLKYSNWLRFINMPNEERDENVSSHFCVGRIFYRTIIDLYPGQELYVNYAYYNEKADMSSSDKVKSE